MIRLFITLALLLLASSGWAMTAEEAKIGQGKPCQVWHDMPRENIGCGDGTAYIYNPLTSEWSRFVADPCLAKMEAAMRAMEPFISNSYWKINGKYVQMFMPLTEETFQQWNSARDQFDAAKRNCWRTP